VFGLLSSVFDYATFGVLLLILHVGTTPLGEALFRTAWFTESVLSASMVVLIIRTRRPFWSSRPSTALVVATAGVWLAVLALPYTPIGALFQLVAMPSVLYAAIAVILALYAASAEVAKHLFYLAELHRTPRSGDRWFAQGRPPQVVTRRGS
jgi:P-type Mg2+ transporter